MAVRLQGATRAPVSRSLAITIAFTVPAFLHWLGAMDVCLRLYLSRCSDLWVRAGRSAGAVGGFLFAGLVLALPAFPQAPGTPPAITTASALPPALVNSTYSQALSASGTAPISWNVANGSLPAGLSLNPLTGVISGIATGPMGFSSFTVLATNAVGSASALISITISALSSRPTIVTGPASTTAIVGQAYSRAMQATGSLPITWSLMQGALPVGLAIESATGLITGTATVLGNYVFTVAAKNASGVSSVTSGITVDSPVLIPPGPVPPIGVNVSEAEYSWGSFPGNAALTALRTKGISLVRLPIAWERAQPTLGGPLDATYLSALKTCLTVAASMDITVIVDLHNYGRYNLEWASDAAANNGYVGVGSADAQVIGSPAVPTPSFVAFWTNLAAELHGTPGLGYYDIMNEPHDMGAPNAWPSIAQAAVNGIRSVDMDTPILVEGTQWASARNWQTANGGLSVNDPANNIYYEAHQYFDADGSANYALTYDQQGAYPAIGMDELQPFLAWLSQNNVRGFLGEFGVPNNDPRWLTVLDNFLTAMQAAGVAGTYWVNLFHSPADPSWWPNANPLAIRFDNGQSYPQLEVIVRHNQPQ
jgi:aryl-phospho-beta-D-glucosidase BglC (GH1 family)